MSIPKRKIAFYSIRLMDKKNTDNSLPTSTLKGLLEFICAFPKKDRVLDNTKEKKIIFLDSMQIISGKYCNLIFKNSRYNHRPNLVDKDTAAERTNPKKPTEGDSEKTHISLSFKKSEIIVLLEERKSGLSMGKFVEYLERFGTAYYDSQKIIKPYKLDFAIIPKSNFLAELEKLSRVKFANVYMEKQILGTKFLGIAKRTTKVNNDIILTVKAEKKQSITDVAREVFNNFGASNTLISKIRVAGTSHEGNQVLIDTDIIKKIEYIDVALDDETGTIEATDIFAKFIEILRTLNE